uniref:OmpH family outer membrane protein n=1 Tax=Acidobacterium capsulatum TaxID=33075 RepID=A0A7V4XUW3_9BACT
MKRSLSLICVLATGLSMNAMAQTSKAPASGTKIAVIMFQAAVAHTNEGERDLADLQKKFAPQREKLQQENQEINTLKQQLQADAKTLNDQQRADRLRVINQKEKDLQQNAQDAQTDFQNALGDDFNGLAQKVGTVMTDYAKAHGYTLVIDAGSQQSPVLWASPSADITKAVIAAYNAKSGVPAPPPSAPAPHPAGKK